MMAAEEAADRGRYESRRSRVLHVGNDGGARPAAQELELVEVM